MSYTNTISMNFEHQYLRTLKAFTKEGVGQQWQHKPDRTGTGTRSMFAHQFRHKMQYGFPLLTTKKMQWKSIVAELLWFISGNTNTKPLNDVGVHIWDEWADDYGDLGLIYGHQWRNCDDVDDSVIDQLQIAIDGIKKRPFSRRIIVDSWTVQDLDFMTLPPCHYAFQFYCVSNRLSIVVSMRSGDMFLGIPFNMASYALLLKIVASLTNKEAHEVVLNIADLHLYNNHLEQAHIQVLQSMKQLPKVELPPYKKIDDYQVKDWDKFKLVGYQHGPKIKAQIAV